MDFIKIRLPILKGEKFPIEFICKFVILRMNWIGNFQLQTVEKYDN